MTLRARALASQMGSTISGGVFGWAGEELGLARRLGDGFGDCLVGDLAGGFGGDICRALKENCSISIRVRAGRTGFDFAGRMIRN